MSNITSAPACPAWCDRHTIGHDFDSVDQQGHESRTHAAEHDPLVAASDHRRRVPTQEVCVDLAAEETLVRSDRGSEASMETPKVVLIAECVRLTAQEARRVAKMLTTTADRLDEINGA